MMKLLRHYLKASKSRRNIKHINRLIKKGYLSEDGTPLKCTKCKSTALTTYYSMYDDFSLIEYGVECTHCGKHLGIWAYGSWTL